MATQLSNCHANLVKRPVHQRWVHGLRMGTWASSQLGCDGRAPISGTPVRNVEGMNTEVFGSTGSVGHNHFVPEIRYFGLF